MAHPVFFFVKMFFGKAVFLFTLCKRYVQAIAQSDFLIVNPIQIHHKYVIDNPNPIFTMNWQSNPNPTIFGKRFSTANVNWLLVYDKTMEFLLNISFHNPIHRIGLQFGFGYPAIQSSNPIQQFPWYFRFIS